MSFDCRECGRDVINELGEHKRKYPDHKLRHTHKMFLQYEHPERKGDDWIACSECELRWRRSTLIGSVYEPLLKGV